MIVDFATERTYRLSSANFCAWDEEGGKRRITGRKRGNLFDELAVDSR